MYLIADESNPNDSPVIAIEHVDDVRGYECEVYKYDGPITYHIIDNVCGILNLKEIKMYSEKCLRSVNSLVRANVKEEVMKQIETELKEESKKIPIKVVDITGKMDDYVTLEELMERTAFIET